MYRHIGDLVIFYILRRHKTMYFMPYLYFNIEISMVLYWLLYFMSVIMSESDILSTEKLRLLTKNLNISTTI